MGGSTGRFGEVTDINAVKNNDGFLDSGGAASGSMNSESAFVKARKDAKKARSSSFGSSYFDNCKSEKDTLSALEKAVSSAESSQIIPILLIIIIIALFLLLVTSDLSLFKKFMIYLMKKETKKFKRRKRRAARKQRRHSRTIAAAAAATATTNRGSIDSDEKTTTCSDIPTLTGLPNRHTAIISSSTDSDSDFGFYSDEETHIGSAGGNKSNKDCSNCKTNRMKGVSLLGGMCSDHFELRTDVLRVDL